MSLYLDDGDVQLYHGDAIAVLQGLPSGIAQTCVTSPPYWGLRDYGTDDQLGLEATPDLYVERMVAVFREVRRVLRDDGTLWLNLGDSYSGGGGYAPDAPSNQMPGVVTNGGKSREYKGRTPAPGLKPKDLVGIPWRLAFALQADGWYLRSDIIWSKPNPMPESVTDRPTKSHEYVFLFSKQPRYFYDADAIREPHTGANVVDGQWTGTPAVNKPDWEPNTQGWNGLDGKGGGLRTTHRDYNPAGRNRRSVWAIPTEPFPEAHFATYPQALVTPCIQAGSKPGDLCLDPFVGSGTTALVARKHGRRCIGIDLSSSYLAIAAKRTSQLSLLGEPHEPTPTLERPRGLTGGAYNPPGQPPHSNARTSDQRSKP